MNNANVNNRISENEINIVCCESCTVGYAPEVGPVDGDSDGCGSRVTFMYICRIVGSGVSALLVAYSVWHLNSRSHVV